MSTSCFYLKWDTGLVLGLGAAVLMTVASGGCFEEESNGWERGGMEQLTVSGHVTDSYDSEPIGNATVDIYHVKKKPPPTRALPKSRLRGSFRPGSRRAGEALVRESMFDPRRVDRSFGRLGA